MPQLYTENWGRLIAFIFSVTFYSIDAVKLNDKGSVIAYVYICVSTMLVLKVNKFLFRHKYLLTLSYLYNAQASFAWPRVDLARPLSAFMDYILRVCQSLVDSFL